MNDDELKSLAAQCYVELTSKDVLNEDKLEIILGYLKRVARFVHVAGEMIELGRLPKDTIEEGLEFETTELTP